ncbi:MaoC/PaaZ C-terminal domain-containing protein [Baekduia sp. Peel2402]|uniref:MaoC/PaaZ C-terminal domain-containing protein n=1 Tax=Baekduia sp. Peel2402 TaxID=3458296 RepID=UPI00403E62BD
MPAIGPALVGHALDPIEWSWTDRDVILYALSVGARLPGDLAYLYERDGPAVSAPFPLAATTLALLPMVAALEIDLKALLHASQAIELRRVPVPEGRATVTRTVTGVWDKGSAAIVDVEDVVDDGSDGGPLAVARSSWWVAGAGGFGGERGTRPTHEPLPVGPSPDLRATIATSPEQAALHRLTGDRNPVHIDPELARAAGQPRPFLHGLCTLGALGHALDRAAGTHRRLTSLSGRFTRPVFPGDTLHAEAFHTTEGTTRARVRVLDDVVLDDAVATYGPTA